MAYFGHIPQGGSYKQLVHYFQIDKSGGRFQQFDYGPHANLEKYGSPEPPEYNLTASTAAVRIFYGLNDWLVYPKDAEKLSGLLPNVLATTPIADREFNHMDFFLAKNVRKELYGQVLADLEDYNKEW